jgi:O-antigen ligase
MSRYLKSEYLFYLAFVVLTTGLLYSRFMISLGMIFFLLAGLLNAKNKSFQGFLKNRYFLSVSVIFLIFAVSGLWSENVDYFLNRMRIKLPFLFLPFAFYAVPRIPGKNMKILSFWFIALICFSVLCSMLGFLLDMDHYIEIYGKGQIMPTPIHHIRYSILVSMAVLMCIYHLLPNQAAAIAAEKKWLILITVLLSVYLHLLAVRSGLMTLYVLYFCLFIYFAIKPQFRKWAAVFSLSLLIAGFLAVNYVPTIQQKLGYMKYSLELFEKNEGIRDLSDSRRLGSIYGGIELIKQHPLTGVGIGDIMDSTNDYLESNYPELTDLELLPHNQYILTAAALGIPLMLVFIFCTIFPIFYEGGQNDFFMLTAHLMLWASFMVEHTIESQIGVAAYIFIVLFALKNSESQAR